MSFSALDSELVGPLFATAAMREAFSDRRRLAAMLQAEAALARAKAGCGQGPAELAAAIDAIEADTLDLLDLGRATALAGVPTIPFIKAVQKRLPPELERSFHEGSTTQDIVDTALVLQMRDGFALLATDLDATLVALLDLARVHREAPCIGRTYRQHAQPISFGFTAAIWCAGIAEVAAELPHVRERALQASLGGPVGSLASFGEAGPAVAEAYAAELGLRAPAVAWHTRRAALAAAGAWLATLIGALAKMATDVVDLASTEVAEVAEPRLPGRGGSSAMPHKRNPVSATVILSAHGAAPGIAAILMTAMAAEHERPAGAWHAEWHALPSLFGLASGALAEARRLAEGLTVDQDRMRENLDATHGLLFADAVAARLTPTLGRSAAHDKLVRAAGQVRDSGRHLRDVLAADPDITAHLSPDALAAAFDPGRAVQAAALWVERAAGEVEHARSGLTR